MDSYLDNVGTRISDLWQGLPGFCIQSARLALCPFGKSFYLCTVKVNHLIEDTGPYEISIKSVTDIFLEWIKRLHFKEPDDAYKVVPTCTNLMTSQYMWPSWLHIHERPFYATSKLSVIIIVIQIAVILLDCIELEKVLARFLGHPKQDPSPVLSYKASSLWVHYPDPKIKIASLAILNSWAVFFITMFGFLDEFLQFDCRQKSYSQTIIEVPLRPIPQVVHDSFQQ